MHSHTFVKLKIQAMVRNKVIAMMALLLICSNSFAQKTTISPKPKLVVGVMVDQMRWDYLYRFQHRYGQNGLKRVLRDGFSCENAQIS